MQGQGRRLERGRVGGRGFSTVSALNGWETSRLLTHPPCAPACCSPYPKPASGAEVLGNALQLSHDQYGNYVVQHLVAKGPQAARWALAVGRQPGVGCCLQCSAAVSYLQGAAASFSRTLAPTAACPPCLRASPVQAAALTSKPAPLLAASLPCARCRDAIVGKVAPQVMALAQHKYASNVVEACLKHGQQAHRDAIIQ